ncbi:hypothetical protein PRIPAC_78339 [Pristionchus pacificus]|uniref:Uncharacterized protein n=1 Tax=Pristionchus pacificus TaxID=54126 RepID=A0A2A6CP94_PRIPA|nr:hypothetical protein PRIPAC_78339 [Pristionchus pacificus]|eukprot:PDM79940.1 hypothetical protein PRIPAC_32519 [Pristionchus pacificus]
MTDARQSIRLSLVDPYYPLAYPDEFTNKLKGSSVTFFDYLQAYLRDITYEYAQYDEYQGPGNRSLTDLGGVLEAIVEGKVLTELSGAGAKPAYFRVFDLSPQAGTDATWSPLSYFIPFSPLMLTLAIVAIVSIDVLVEMRKRRKSSLLTSITAGIRHHSLFSRDERVCEMKRRRDPYLRTCLFSSAFFVFGVTFLVFAYGAGFQGNMIAATPPEQIPYDSLLREFENGARQWYFRLFGLADFSSLSTIPRYEEQDVRKLIGLMCERPGVVTAALYKEEYLEMQLYDAPSGCNIQKVNLVAPTHPSPTYNSFATTYYYFLLPKKLPRRLRDGINFVANSVFQPDHLEGHLLYRSVKPRSFVDITPVKAPLADYSPLSLYGLGVIILIFVALLSLSILVFTMEIIVYRLKMTRIAILLLLVSATSTNAVPVDGNNNLASGIAGAVSDVRDLATNTVDQSLSAVSKAVSSLVSSVNQLSAATTKAVAAVNEGVTGAISGATAATSAALKDALSSASKAVQSTTARTLNGATAATSATLNAAVSSVAQAVAGALNTATAASGAAIKDALSSVSKAASEVVASTAKITDAATKALATTSTVVGELTDDVASGAKDIGGTVSDTAGSATALAGDVLARVGKAFNFQN